MRKLITTSIIASVLLLMPCSASATKFENHSGVNSPGENKCKPGFTLVTPTEAKANKDQACNVLGRWDIVRLQFGGSMGGRGYNCKVISKGDLRNMGGSLCRPDIDNVIKEQRQKLAKAAGALAGPQSPRSIDSIVGNIKRHFSLAPAFTDMNLCNIHFHKNAEHQGGQFTNYAGNGNGEGYQSGYRFDIDNLSVSELKPAGKICDSHHSTLRSGDTIEVHYVFTSDKVEVGKGLKPTCFAESRKDKNQNAKGPFLRVETQVYVLVNNKDALSFEDLTAFTKQKDPQVKKADGSPIYTAMATGIPKDDGTAVQYIGSTTGPGYNEKLSPYQVTWNVRPKVAKVDIKTVGKWCKGNAFEEDHGHGVRNLVKNLNLLSEIK